MAMIAKDLNGMVFGELTIVCKEPKIIKNGKVIHMWRAVCSCGNEVIKRTGEFTRKNAGTKCRKCMNITHGLRSHKLYGTWLNMKDRCLNPNNPSYKSYKDRGICEEWKNSSESFILWSLKNGYMEGLSIDRIKNEIGYTPDNCRWVDSATQSRNREYTLQNKGILELIRKDIDDNILSQSQIARKYEVSISSVNRLKNKRTYQ
jgi:hypothetical protein